MARGLATSRRTSSSPARASTSGSPRRTERAEARRYHRRMRFEAQVEVTHLPGVLDPQGQTVERALPALGYTNVSDVRIGKSIRLVINASDEAAARAQVEEMCERILANPVIEAYTITLHVVADA